MADEPTGALDSATGRQVLDTLKKLSVDKLVIVVSHDREFAEKYADRIIELADGKVIRDVEPDNDAVEAEVEKLLYDNGTVTVPCGYHLTEDDRNAINEYIASLGTDVKLSVKSGDSSNRKFRKSDTTKLKSYDGSTFKLIRSKLPLKNAFKMGSSALKFKKVRLVFTILLSFAAFTMFGLADTFGSYNHVETCTNSIIDSDITYASIVKSKRVGEGISEWWYDWGNNFTDKDIAEISRASGHDFSGVYVPETGDLRFTNNFDDSIELTKSEIDIYANSFSGFIEMTAADAQKMGYSLLAGRLPEGGKNEIAISKYVYLTFQKTGYINYSADSADEDGAKSKRIEKINNYNDMIGKTLNIFNSDFTVTGIVDTGFDITRYEGLTEDSSRLSTKDRLVNFLLANELESARQYSYTGAAMVGEGTIATLVAQHPNVLMLHHGSLSIEKGNDQFYLNCISRLSDLAGEEIIWLDGEKKALAENEVIISLSDVYNNGEYSTHFSIDEENFENELAEIIEKLKDKTFSLSYYDHYSDTDYNATVKIVGIIDNVSSEKELPYGTMVLNDSVFGTIAGSSEGIYKFAVTSMPETKADIKNLVEYCYTVQGGNTKYPLQNAVTYELDTVNEALKVFSKVLLYTGIGFAVFAALMLSNFIATSISHKKREIGILRAIGSRSNDVFRIFFAESFIIAMINFVLASIGTGVITAIANYLLRSKAGILITVLNFGIRQIALLLILSLLVAAVASFIPVKRIASKKPIDAIRNR